jgi:DNA replication protein DnaC
MTALAMNDMHSAGEEIGRLLTTFKLPTAAAELVRRLTDAGHADALATVLEVLRDEVEARQGRRVTRLRRASQLLPAKRFDTLDTNRLPRELAKRLREIERGDFLERAVNVLAFGLPGTGKTHAACAIGHALVERGHSVLFTPTFKLVQELLAAKRELSLPRALRKLDAFELLILDDIGYVQQEPEEVEVLFTLMAERYERRSLLITSNLVFSEWDRIFKNPMTTAAAIDRLVHHSVILEFDVPSYRTAEAETTKKNKVKSKKEEKED